jgi:hypothetical protein
MSSEWLVFVKDNLHYASRLFELPLIGNLTLR